MPKSNFFQLQLKKAIEDQNYSKAIHLYEKHLTLEPLDYVAHHNFAILLRQQNKNKDAFDHSEKAYQLQPKNATIVFSFGLSNENLNLVKEAIALYKNAIELMPCYPAALNNLALLLDRTDQSLEGLKLLSLASELNPKDSMTLHNLAKLHLSTGNPRRARELIKSYSLPDTFNILGVTEYVERNWSKAEKLFRIAVENNPNSAEAHENLALTLLQQGKYKAGWKEYLWRWQNQSNQIGKQLFSEPLWDGRSIKNKNLLIRTEQGLGDTIQFIRFLPLIKKANGRIIVTCTKELLELLKLVPDIDQTVLKSDQLPDFDYQTPLININHTLNLNGKTYNQTIPYITLGNHRKSADIETKIVKIGFCWSGRPRHSDDPYRNRSCSDDHFRLLASMTGVSLYSIQIDCNNMVVQNDFVNKTPVSKLGDLLETAKLIASLDFIVSIDTSVIHLAGALGKSGIVLLCYSSDWRWGNNDGPSPWYPDIHMIRQTRPGDWEGVFQKTKRFIEKKFFGRV